MRLTADFKGATSGGSLGLLPTVGSALAPGYWHGFVGQSWSLSVGRNASALETRDGTTSKEAFDQVFTVATSPQAARSGAADQRLAQNGSLTAPLSELESERGAALRECAISRSAAFAPANLPG